MLPSKQWLVVSALAFVVIGTIIGFSRNAEESLRAEIATLQSQLDATKNDLSLKDGQVMLLKHCEEKWNALVNLAMASGKVEVQYVPYNAPAFDRPAAADFGPLPPYLRIGKDVYPLDCME